MHIYTLKTVMQLEDKLSQDIAMKSKGKYICSKQADIAISMNSDYFVSRRLKTNKDWEILKECSYNNETFEFPKVHKKEITSVDLIREDKYVMTTGKDGLVALYFFENQKIKKKVKKSFDRVMCTSTLNLMAVVGGRDGFEFFGLKPLEYVDYRDPKGNKMDKLLSRLLGEKNDKKTGVKLSFKCTAIRALCFGTDEHDDNVLIFAGSNS